ncbi:glycoside hydrolase family 2 protein [Nocardiopsis suaedae]|uniref:beta-mannosidase n=1 Tax=Nocardiopsis suaedae TaxID=3018444 RepID=A0ABT4TFM7_9ACTN|nr:glycoside hydrolase family 2 protein [Nocardiopsis suaedae]MDA2803426.1 glycoside hydrolase family 2 protein [Nocardiopsis suaedae]
MAVQWELAEGWSVRAASQRAEAPEGELPASVPGCVHTDLVAAGVIGDPTSGRGGGEEATAWIGRTDWTYARAVRTEEAALADSHERVDLVFDGLDTVADVSIGGHALGGSRNMHRSYRFDATGALRGGAGRELAVAFASPYSYAEDMRERLGARPAAYDEPYQFIRKMACNFGWDWGPTVVTSGIWRPVRLHAWSTARLAQVRPEATIEEEDGRTRGVVRLHVRIERTGQGRDTPLTLTARLGGREEAVHVAAGRSHAVVEAECPDPELWWPRGYGGQPLYGVGLTLADAREGRILDEWHRDIGFRTVDLDTRPDDDGTPFTVRVNGRPVLVKGFNWIPDDCFPSRIAPGRYAERIGQAIGAGANLLRVWGGGIYESADFYRVCDERGVLVWQDFPFACAAYPEEEPLASEVEAEAREGVVRLAHHPSLALWCGNNENLWGRRDWGWEEELAGRTWGEGFYHGLLPRVVAELDPTRPYIPGSPYAPPGHHPNDPAHGPAHIWDVWNERDYTAYREYRPRFVSEFGFQAPPAFATLRGAVPDGPLAPDAPGVLRLQKAEDGAGKLARGLAPHFGSPRSDEDWHFLAQVNQARAMAVGVGHFRAQWPRCSGTVVWQLNDCWPSLSWSAVDGPGRRKPVWFALRRAFAERTVALVPDGGSGLAAVLGNDTDREWASPVRLVRRSLSGAVLAESEVRVAVAARGAARVALPEELTAADDPARECVTAEAEGAEREWWFFAEDAETAFPDPVYDVKTRTDGGRTRVTVAAGSLLRDLCLFPDRLDPAAEADDGLITLLPGESHTFTVDGVAEADAAALGGPPVLRCVNDAVRGG